MKALYEWQLSTDPDGLVSIVVRMSSEEAAALAGVDLNDPSQPDATTAQTTHRQLIETLQQAVIDGLLVVPG